ncbi:hypothetical protein X975_09275, partial [Stegodyphus mimosarum]
MGLVTSMGSLPNTEQWPGARWRQRNGSFWTSRVMNFRWPKPGGRNRSGQPPLTVPKALRKRKKSKAAPTTSRQLTPKEETK